MQNKNIKFLNYKKSIIFICNSSEFFISHRLNLAIDLNKKGYKIIIATPNYFDKNLLLKYNLIHKKFFLKRSSINFFYETKTFLSLLKLIKDNHTSIIHLITIRPMLYGGIIARILKLENLVFSFPGLGYIFISNNIFIKFIKLIVYKLLKFALNNKKPKYIFQNESDIKKISHLININKKKNINLIQGSGVDLNYYIPTRSNDNKFRILMASRLLKSKGIYDYIKAAEIVKKQEKNIEFILVGWKDENPSSLTRKEISELKTNKSINYLGFEKNMINLFKIIDVAVYPSYYGEGIPKFLLESAACGKPIITTNIDGCSNAILNEKTGFLVSPKNPSEIAEKIMKFYSDNELCNKMSRNSRIYAEKTFSITDVTNKHYELYEDLLID